MGIIGVGLLGNFHNQAIQTIIEGQYLLDDIRVSVDAICDNREEHLKEYANTWEIGHAYKDYQKLLDIDDINAVYIATPTFTHEEIFVAAADVKKHISVQKP